MKRKSKSEMVLEIYDQEAMGEVTAREIALINQKLIDEFGEGGSMSPAEIARILIDEDLPVRLDQVFRMSALTDKYEDMLEGLALNKSLKQAEHSIRRIDSLHREFLKQSDKTGARLARQTAIRAKENALALSRNTANASTKRAEHLEIAQWFTVWLQTPDIFEHWLELRKTTDDFKARFGEILT